MDQQKKAVSTFQLFAILVRATVGVGLLGMAREVTANAKQDGWIAVLLAGAVAVGVMFLWVLLMERFPQYTILDITECLMGTSSAKIVGGIYTLYYLTGLGIVARELTELMSVWFLEKTPFVVIMSIAMVPVIYINHKGIHCLVHFTEIIFMISIPFILILFAGVSYLDIYNLMPVGGGGIQKYSQGCGGYDFCLCRLREYPIFQSVDQR